MQLLNNELSLTELIATCAVAFFSFLPSKITCLWPGTENNIDPHEMPTVRKFRF